MSITDTYEVFFEPFTERHFIKTFARKYKGAWNTTLSFLKEEFKFFNVLAGKSIAEIIVDSIDIKICKTEFKISGTRESRHGSGNRCIVAIHKKACKVCVLLVYSKSDLGSNNETASWKALVRENYPDYAEMV